MARLIDLGIAAAHSAGTVIDTGTARRIAACLHRGFGGELERFAGTGHINNLHAARLELFYSALGEPNLQPWRQALKAYLRHYRDDNGDNDGRGDGRTKPITPPPVGMSCEPGTAVAYLRTDTRDPVSCPGLALQVQHHACRAYARHRLHQRLSAVFTDSPGNHGQGLTRLLAHLALCHNQRVVVHRLDRLPPGSPAAQRITALGARVLSVTECHTRTSTSQAALGRDLNQLNHPKETV